MKRAAIKQDEANPVPTEVIATSIVKISRGVKALRKGRLSDKALIILLQHSIPTDSKGARITQRDIRNVLDAIESLEADYIQKAK